MSSPDYQQQAKLARALARGHVKLVEALDKELAQHDMTAAQYAVVSALASGRANSAGQICNEISYDSGAMTRMLDRMESKGILQRTRSVEDRRAVLVELTPHGKALFPELLESTSSVLSRYFAQLNEEDIVQLLSLLGKMGVDASAS